MRHLAGSMDNPLARSERRRAAKFAVRGALAGLDEADARIVLEDVLTDLYAPRDAASAAGAQVARQEPPPPPPPVRQVPPPPPSVQADGPALSIAQRMLTAMAREPARVFGITELAKAIPGVDAEQINSEVGRQARKGTIERTARGKYRWRSQGGNGTATAQGGAR